MVAEREIVEVDGKNWFCEEASSYKEDEVGSCKIKLACISGRLDGYLGNRDWLLETDNIWTPILGIDGSTMMSLTQMEVDSHRLHIGNATGNVLVGGLGLGYFVRMIEGKDDVNSITVVEKNADVIELITKQIKFSDKVKIVNEDIFEHKGEYDFAYIDIWGSMDFDLILEDMHEKILNNIIADRYGFWGQEQHLRSEYGFDDTDEYLVALDCFRDDYFFI